MCTLPTEVTHACLLDLDSTASCSRHGSLLCLDPQAQAIYVSPYQICAHQAFTCRNRSHRRGPWPSARKTQKSGQQKASHAPPRAKIASESLPRAASDSLTSRSCSCTCAAMTASSTTDLPTEEIWLSKDVARTTTRHLGFWPLLHAPVNMHAPPTSRN